MKKFLRVLLSVVCGLAVLYMVDRILLFFSLPFFEFIGLSGILRLVLGNTLPVAAAALAADAVGGRRPRRIVAVICLLGAALYLLVGVAVLAGMTEGDPSLAVQALAAGALGAVTSLWALPGRSIKA